MENHNSVGEAGSNSDNFQILNFTSDKRLENYLSLPNTNNLLDCLDDEQIAKDEPKIKLIDFNRTGNCLEMSPNKTHFQNNLNVANQCKNKLQKENNLVSSESNVQSKQIPQHSSNQNSITSNMMNTNKMSTISNSFTSNNSNNISNSNVSNNDNKLQLLNNVNLISCGDLANLLQANFNNHNNLIIDCRSFLEYNSCHIQKAINVCCSKIIKRRLQNDKITICELLNNNTLNGFNLNKVEKIIVYDQCSKDLLNLSDDNFIRVLFQKLIPIFKQVIFLEGGFTCFNNNFNSLCTNKTQIVQCKQKKLTLNTLSQTCKQILNLGPTRILPFLYLGSQIDAMNADLLKHYNITYELNVSTSCPKPDFIQDSCFLRIPVNDNYSDKLLPYFPQAINFLDKVRESNSSVLVHCLGGISRSATIAIAYLMNHMRISSDDAYRFLKKKRATISPNFNFLGQLLEYEKQLIDNSILNKTKENSKCLLSSNENFDIWSSHNSFIDFYLNESNDSTQATNQDIIFKKAQSSCNSPKLLIPSHHFNSPFINSTIKSNLNSTNLSKSNVSSQEKLVSDVNKDEKKNFNVLLNNSIIDGTACTINQNPNNSMNCNNSTQKRTCSFSSISTSNPRKINLKLPVNETCDTISSVFYM